MARNSVRSMFGNLKSRFTGRSSAEEEEYYDEDDYDYESYEDYEEDSYAPERSSRRYEDRSHRFAAELDERYSKAVTTRPSRNYSSPRLVSMDDVRASTSVYSGAEQSADDRGYSREQRRAATRAASSVTPVGTAASSVGAGGGIDSLFASTNDYEEQRVSNGVEERESFSTSSQTRRFGVTRALEVVRPLTYAEAERVAKGLKAGDAVVLSLKSTPDHLAGRLVDFAFGVACGLDATVERLSPKVYALTRNADLSDTERSMLKNQGVI